MSRILAIDTSTEACSAALVDGSDTVFSVSEVCPREHNKKILKMVEQVLQQANCQLADVDALAFACGPGSFTGVRVATGIVQGLAFGADKPVIAVSTLAAMAHQVFRLHQQSFVLSAIDARMSEIYLGQYQIEAIGHVVALANEQVLKPDAALADIESKPWAAIGTGWQTYNEQLTAQCQPVVMAEHSLPDAIDVAYIAQTKWAKGEVQQATDVVPTYVRDEVTWQKLPGK